MRGRLLGKALALIGLLVLLVAGLIWWGLSTEGGSRRVVAFLLGKSPVGLEIAGIHGSIRGPLYLTGVRYRSGSLSAEIDSALLDIKISHLARGRVMLERVYVTGMRIVLPDSAPKDTAGTAQARRESPRPPIPVEVGEGRVSRFELDAPRGVSIREGEIRLAGTLAHYRFDLAGTVFVPQIDTARVHLGGRGSLESIQLDSTSTGELIGGRIIPTGTVTWWPEITWNLELAADDIEPARLLTNPALLPGRVSLQAMTKGRIDSSGPSGEASLTSIAGCLRGQTVSGTAELTFRSTALERVRTDLRVASARVQSEGAVGDTIALKYVVDVSDVRQFVDGIGGSLTLSGTATGPMSTPQIRADVRGSHVSAPGVEARRVFGKADVSLAKGGRAVVDLRADSVTLASRPYDRLDMTLRGPASGHRIALKASSSVDTVRLVLAGALAKRNWGGRVDSLTVLTAADDWRLIEPAPLVVSPGLVRLDSLCVAGDSLSGGLCAEGEWRNAATWHVVATIDSVGLESLPMETQGAPKLGLVAARVEARNTSTGLLATVTASLADSGGGQVGHLEGKAELPGYRLGRALAQHPVEARVTGRLENLELVRATLMNVDSLQGTLVADFTASGTVDAPRVVGGARIDSLRMHLKGRRDIDGSLVLRTDMTVGPDRLLEGEAELVTNGLDVQYTHQNRVERQSVSVDSGAVVLVAREDGTRTTAAVTLLSAGQDSLAGLNGELYLPGFRQLRAPPLSQAVKFRLDANLADLAVLRPFVLSVDSLAGTADLTVEGVGSIGAPSATGTLSIEDMSAQFSSGTLAQGGIAGAFELVVANDSSITGSFTLRPAGLRVSPVQGDSASGVWFRNSALEVTAGADGVRASLNATLASDGDTVVATLRGQGALSGYNRVGSPLARVPLEATIEGRVDDFGFLPAFVTAVDSAAGTMRLDVRVTGTAGESHLAGNATLSDVALRMPEVGILLEDLQLTAKGENEGKIAVKATMKSGGGQLAIEGETPLQPTRTDPGHLTVRGEKFLAANNGRVHAFITPNLEVTIAGDTLGVSGQVDLPVARIELSELPEVAIRPSDDVVVVENVGRPKSERPIFADVRVVLGEDVSFAGFNFDAELGGTLNLVEAPGRPTRATGTLVIQEGRYQSYGQDLTVTNGEVRFNGPVNNPGLNIRALRVVHDTITVGISMMGYLKEPDVRLFSQPAMAPTQILSYIVTGGPVGGSGSSGNLINKALSALGLGGGSQVVNALGQDIGLSSARIETEGDLQDASLVVGKYLNPRVYLSYGVGLFDPVSTLRLRYLLSNRFTLQVETGRATSADAVVRVKRK